MRLPSRHEDKGRGFHGMPVRAVQERSPSAGDHVDLVARMRLLGIDAVRRVELHLERAVGKDGRGEIAGRWGPFESAFANAT